MTNAALILGVKLHSLYTYFFILAICLFTKHDRHFQFLFEEFDSLFVGCDTILQNLGAATIQ